MSLFQWGNFKLHSGEESWWRIDCDDLTESEIELFAHMIMKYVGHPIHEVACPTSHAGSAALKLRDALKPSLSHFIKEKYRVLIVDDVLTTGTSMIEKKKEIDNSGFYPTKPEFVGAVIFARGKCPDWVTPIFQLSI